MSRLRAALSTRVARATARGDEGGGLILVLGVSVVLLGMMTVGVVTVSRTLTQSALYQNTQEASYAALGGLDTVLATLRNTSSFASYPCAASGSETVAGARGNWSVTVSYSSNSSSISCTGSSSTLGGTTQPTSATLVSTGSVTGAPSAVMDSTIAITGSSTFNYAIFTTKALSIDNNMTLGTMSGGSPPNLYSAGTFTCNNTVTSTGSVITYQPVDITVNCSFGGSLTSAGEVQLNGVDTVSGDLTSYGGGVIIGGSGESGDNVGGNITETGGNVAVDLGTVAGNVYASGSITKGSAATIKGTQTPNDSSLSSQSMPTATPFPTLNPTVANWTAAGWTVDQVASASCATYFADNGNDGFTSALGTLTGNTVIYAPSCAVAYANNSYTFKLPYNVVLQVASLDLGNNATFESSSSAVHDFTLMAATSSACTTTTEVTSSNSTAFATSLNVLLYTEGAVSFTNNVTPMDGQIYACGGFTTTNTSSLDFDNKAASDLGLSGTSGSGTITIASKYLAQV